MKYSIRTNILFTFTVILTAITVLLITSQYYFNKKIAVKETEKTFNIIRENIAVEVKNILTDRRKMLLRISKDENINAPVTGEKKHPAFDDFTNLLTLNPDVTAIYFAHKDGSYYNVINYDFVTKERELDPLLKNTKWLVVTSDAKNTFQYFIDQKENLLATKQIKDNLYVSDRPWYKSAINTHKVIATPLYTFNTLQEKGMSYAIETEEKGTVLGIDYTLKSLDKLTSRQLFSDNAEIFLFNYKGRILYRVNRSDNPVQINKSQTIDKTIKAALDIQDEVKLIKYNQQDTYYFVSYKQLPNTYHYLGVKVNATELFKPYKRNAFYSLFIALGLFILSLPIIYYATNKIIEPIKKLIKENNKIYARNFTDVNTVDTNILEFRELSHSLVTMSQSIETYQKSQVAILDSIVKLIAEAVDAKSPYTGGHCERVPEIALLLVKAASLSEEKAFRSFSLQDRDALKEFEIGAWLHDCGKVTTPEYVVDKSTKLETINNRIHEVRTRFEVLWRDTQISYLENIIKGKDKTHEKKLMQEKQAQLLDDFIFIAEVNIGGEFMDETKQERVQKIAQQTWLRNFDDTLGVSEAEKIRSQGKQKLPVLEQLLSDKKCHLIERENFDYEAYKKDGFKLNVPEYLYNKGEIYNLCITKGTLTHEERYKINEHVIMSIKMLEKIPFPKEMLKIPQYAGTHHETLIGTGYPRKLAKDELSIPARVMAIADIFEALTASDRPYKKAKTLSEAIKIMSFMVKDKSIDEDLFKLFLQSDLHNTYAKKYLKREQIDSVDLEQYL